MATQTTLELIQYYIGLLIVQYVDKPKARATVETFTTADVMPQTSVQTITFSVVPTQGEFVVSWNGVSSAPIEWDDSAATVAAKIQAITGLATVTVTGSPADLLITVTFTGITPVAELLVVESSTLGNIIDGGFADTVYTDDYDGGDAFGTGGDIIDGGDAFGTGGGYPVIVTVAETDEILPLAVQNGFNIIAGTVTAVGAQLDVIGKYVGVTRTGQGFTSQITLDDSDYLQLIRMAIIKNAAGSSLSIIQDFIQQFFPGDMLVFDYQNMHMSYLLSEGIGSPELVQLFITEGLLPKPMAVQVATVIYAPVITEFFGFRTYELPAFNANPFNNYTSYQTDWPWLSYSDAI